MSAPFKELKPLIDHDELLAVIVPLFAREPSLAKKLLEMANRETASEKIPTFFDYLFVAAPRCTSGADYKVVGYRLRDENERDSTLRAENGDLADFDCHDDPSLEITDDMAKAGVTALKPFLFEGDQVFRSSHRDLVCAVFEQMHRALVSKPPLEHRRSAPECPESSVPIVLMERVLSDSRYESIAVPLAHQDSSPKRRE